MKERPIPFSGPMVPSILAGTNTQTRRVLKSQPYTLRTEGFGYPTKAGGFVSIESEHCLKECPYGKPGDRLWLRESHWRFTGCAYQGRPWESFRESPDEYAYSAVCYDDSPILQSAQDAAAVVRVPSIHMPRWASRITLEITEVRVQRLQEISEKDAVAEGIYRNPVGRGGGWRYAEDEPTYGFAVSAYRHLWESINGPGSWDANPWVWAISFRRLCG